MVHNATLDSSVDLYLIGRCKQEAQSFSHLLWLMHYKSGVNSG